MTELNALPVMIVVVMAWVFVYGKLQAVRYSSSQDTNSTSAINSWWVLVSLAVAASFTTSPLRIDFNAIIFDWIQLANLSQFIEGLATMAAGYNIALLANRVSAAQERNIAVAKGIRNTSLILMAAYIAHYFLFAASASNMLSDIPTSLSGLLLKVVPYIYCCLLAVRPLRSYLIHLHKETHPHLTIRLRFWLIGIASAILLSIIMAIWMTIAFLDANNPFLAWLTPLSAILLIGAAQWMFGFLPRGVIARIYAIVVYGRSILYYLKLNAIADKLNNLVEAPYKPSEAGLLRILNEPAACTHEQVIALLDQLKIILGRCILSDALRKEIEGVLAMGADEADVLALAEMLSRLNLAELPSPRRWGINVEAGDTSQSIPMARSEVQHD